MKVAIISDLHGNMRALEAVLEDIGRLSVDQIICAGDVVNPFLRSLDVWLKLKELGIPVIRGNHEDYIVSYFEPGDRPEICTAVQFKPIQLVARHLSTTVAAEFKKLPFDMTIQGPGGDELYICHASPQHNARSYIRGVDASMEPSIRAISARTIVAGHIHGQWKGQWQDKTLIIAGSVGLPLEGVPRPQYVMMTHHKGEWIAQHRTVAYDRDGALKEYRESGGLAQGGPIAWMLHDELECAEARLARFLPLTLSQTTPPVSLVQWETATRAYLKKLGRWNFLKQHL